MVTKRKDPRTHRTYDNGYRDGRAFATEFVTIGMLALPDLERICEGGHIDDYTYLRELAASLRKFMEAMDE